jgi:hypothetical protein
MYAERLGQADRSIHCEVSKLSDEDELNQDYNSSGSALGLFFASFVCFCSWMRPTPCTCYSPKLPHKGVGSRYSEPRTLVLPSRYPKSTPDPFAWNRLPTPLPARAEGQRR